MVSQHKISITISDELGSVSGIVLLPEKVRTIFVIAHGAGAGMQHAFMEQIADALSQVGWATLRFNFPFTENNKKRPDSAYVAEQTVAAAIRYAQEHYAYLPCYVGGKSFGGRMTTQYIAKNRVDGISGVILLGFPLHPAGKPSEMRGEHLQNVTKPMVFIQGTRDALAHPELLRNTCAKLSQASLVWIEGADHGFTRGKGFRIQEIIQAIMDWETKVNESV